MYLPDKRAGGPLALILTITIICLVAGQRVPPGVNPKRYQVPEQKPLPYQRQQILNTGNNIQQERLHIQEHLPVSIDTSKMTQQELQFHYFKMHDADNNNKLDGCELLKSLIHSHDKDGQKHPQVEQEKKILTDEELAALIDPILQRDDTSGDGFIDYLEFVKAQEGKQKLQLQEPQQKQKQQKQQKQKQSVY